MHWDPSNPTHGRPLADVPGAMWEVKGAITHLYLCLSFGFLGSPGEYEVWATAAKRFNEHYGPDNPRWNGKARFKVFFLVDDKLKIEVLLGVRPFVVYCSAR